MALLAAPGALLLATSRLVVRRLSNGVNSGVHGRRSCTPVEVQECTPCPQTPKPECREAHNACPQGLRVVCCPPPPGARPPCPPPLSSSPLTCRDVKLLREIAPDSCNVIRSKGSNTNACGAQLDRVARRIENAKQARRADYEREVLALDSPKVAIPAPSIRYPLGGERECMRATDGRDYAVTDTQNKRNRCDQSRSPPPPCPVNLELVDHCEVNRERHVDPCSHQPRIFLEIDRNSNSTETTKQSAASLTTRIIESFKRNGGTAPHQTGGTLDAEKSAKSCDRKSWCTKLPTPKSVLPHCKEPSITEQLGRRHGGTCSESCTPHRQLHTKSNLCGDKASSCSSRITDEQIKTSVDKVESIMQEKLNLKEAGQGRVVTSHEKTNKNQNIGGGGLELKVPPSTDAVRVRVLVDFSSIAPQICKTDGVFEALDTQIVSSSVSSHGTESWLSLKNLQQKLSGRKKGETAPGTKESPKRNSASPSACSQGKRPSNPTLCPRPSQRKQTSLPSSQSPSPSSPGPPCPPSDSLTKSQYVPARDQVLFS